LQWAADRASSLGADLHVVTVISLPLPVGSPSVPGACLPDRDRLVESGLALQQTIVDESIGNGPWVRVVNIVEFGEPRRVLPKAAAAADLLVLGPSRRRGFRSLTSQCLRHATCPVVVVVAGRPC
jgi:nucleotide-binding universal stress UspA family protein